MQSEVKIIHIIVQDQDGQNNSKRKFSRKPDLMVCLAEEWKEIPLTVITNLIDSMPARCAIVVKSKGFATKYWSFWSNQINFWWLITCFVWKLQQIMVLSKYFLFTLFEKCKKNNAVFIIKCDICFVFLFYWEALLLLDKYYNLVWEINIYFL